MGIFLSISRVFQRLFASQTLHVQASARSIESAKQVATMVKTHGSQEGSSVNAWKESTWEHANCLLWCPTYRSLEITRLSLYP